ncbi:MAG: hypothetical protein ABI905_04310 [Betaproteobacteria bacterium]
MPEVQAPGNNSPAPASRPADAVLADPRWILLRVSRINLAITLLGALLAFPLMWWLSMVPAWIRFALLMVFAASMAWDLWLILLKGRHSVGAFYLFDLDRAGPRTAEGARAAGSDAPKLGIQIRFANAAKHLLSAEREGVVLPKAFVSPYFTALRYRLPDDPAWRRYWPRVIPLWTDSLDADEFRRLRVMLKWK